jgi:hypothetical protein
MKMKNFKNFLGAMVFVALFAAAQQAAAANGEYFLAIGEETPESAPGDSYFEFLGVDYDEEGGVISCLYRQDGETFSMPAYQGGRQVEGAALYCSGIRSDELLEVRYLRDATIVPENSGDAGPDGGLGGNNPPSLPRNDGQWMLR